MTDADIFRVIDASFCDCSQPHIGFSGGEAFVYFDRLCRILRYATSKGAVVSVNTNGFWGRDLDAAYAKVRTLREIPVRKIVLSIDDFHEEFINRQSALNVVKACKHEHLEVELQFVATRRTRRLADLLKDAGDTLLNINCREIPCHPVGRAEQTVSSDDLFFSERLPQGLCPSSVMSISAYGRVMPCCNTASHLPTLQVGSIRDDLPALHERFQIDAVLTVMRSLGPHTLVAAAEMAGYQHPSKGYIDQCHLCYCLFKQPSIAQAVKEGAKRILEAELLSTFKKHYEQNEEEDESTVA